MEYGKYKYNEILLIFRKQIFRRHFLNSNLGAGWPSEKMNCPYMRSVLLFGVPQRDHLFTALFSHVIEASFSGHP